MLQHAKTTSCCNNVSLIICNTILLIIVQQREANSLQKNTAYSAKLRKSSEVTKLMISLLALLCVFVNTNFVLAQSRIYNAIINITAQPNLDGLVNEQYWNNDNWQGDFIQYEPTNGAEAQCKTEFNLVYDRESIYIGIRAYDVNPEEIVKRVSRRDAWEGDLIEIHFDSYMDKRTSFVFSINAAGSIGDRIY